jgi:Fe-S cluster assembly ATPase SufC
MPYNEKSRANLKNFEKGNKLGGRTKGSLNIATLIERALMAPSGKGKSTEAEEIIATGIVHSKKGDVSWAKYLTDLLVTARELHEKKLAQQALQLNQQINVNLQQQKYDLTRLTPDELNTWRELARKCAVDQGT